MNAAPLYPRGIINEDNTCYLNCIIQLFSTCENLISGLPMYLTECESEQPLSKLFLKTVSDLKQRYTGPIRGQEFKQLLFNLSESKYHSGISYGEQQDAAEFLSYFINLIQEEVSLTSGEQFLKSMFDITYKQLLSCCDCLNVSITSHSTSVLAVSIPIKEKTDLNAVLTREFSQERIERNCTHCNSSSSFLKKSVVTTGECFFYFIQAFQF